MFFQFVFFFIFIPLLVIGGTIFFISAIIHGFKLRKAKKRVNK